MSAPPREGGPAPGSPALPLPPPAAGPAAASFGARVAALLGHEVRLALRRGESLLVTFVIPPAALLGAGALGAGDAGRLLPGAITLAVAAAALVSLGITTGYERAYGVLRRLGGSPAGPAAVVASRILLVLLVEAAQAALLAGLAWGALGWRPGPDASPLLAALAVALGTAAFAGLGLALAGALRPEATMALTNLLFLLVLALGGLLVPLDRLPDAVAAVAAVLPPAVLADALGAALGAGGDPGGPLALLGAWADGLGSLAVRRFRWS